MKQQNSWAGEPELARARAGDGAAFDELIKPYLPGLRLHCYRMLGSLVDAEDALQETLLAAWRGLAGYAEQASLRTWLIRIATTRCLNAIRSGRRSRPPEPVAPFPVPPPTRHDEVSWLQPLPGSWCQVADAAPGPAARYDSQESVRLAFVAALQRMPPRQTAALVLVDVLGYSTAEAAEMLSASATALKGVLQRARAAMPAPGSWGEPGLNAGRDAVASRFAVAFTSGDVAGVLALLTDEAVLSMPPAPHEYVGHGAIGAFLAASFRWRGQRRSVLLPVSANGQPGFACYLGERGARLAAPAGLFVLTMANGAIGAATRFQDAHLPQRFGLPGTVALD